MHVAINKFAAIVNNFTRDKVSTKGIIWIDNCIVIHSWTEDSATRSKRAIFEHNSD